MTLPDFKPNRQYRQAREIVCSVAGFTRMCPQGHLKKASSAYVLRTPAEPNAAPNAGTPFAQTEIASTRASQKKVVDLLGTKPAQIPKQRRLYPPGMTRSSGFVLAVAGQYLYPAEWMFYSTIDCN